MYAYGLYVRASSCLAGVLLRSAVGFRLQPQRMPLGNALTVRTDQIMSQFRAHRRDKHLVQVEN